MATMMSERTLLPAEPAAYDQLDALLRSGEISVFLSGTAADSERLALPEDLLAVLSQVVRTLHEGVAVVVSPRPTRLTTQQAADVLGVSRPTLVKLLENGEIVYDRPNSHRYIELRDLLDYQKRSRAQRRRFAEQMAEEAADRLDQQPDRIVSTR